MKSWRETEHESGATPFNVLGLTRGGDEAKQRYELLIASLRGLNLEKYLDKLPPEQHEGSTRKGSIRNINVSTLVTTCEVHASMYALRSPHACRADPSAAIVEERHFQGGWPMAGLRTAPGTVASGVGR